MGTAPSGAISLPTAANGLLKLGAAVDEAPAANSHTNGWTHPPIAAAMDASVVDARASLRVVLTKGLRQWVRGPRGPGVHPTDAGPSYRQC